MLYVFSTRVNNNMLPLYRLVGHSDSLNRDYHTTALNETVINDPAWGGDIVYRTDMNITSGILETQTMNSLVTLSCNKNFVDTELKFFISKDDMQAIKKAKKAKDSYIIKRYSSDDFRFSCGNPQVREAGVVYCGEIYISCYIVKTLPISVK